MERIALIDVSAEDDLLVPFPVESPVRREGFIENHAMNLCVASPSRQNEDLTRVNLSEHSNSPEQKRRLPEMYNLRKSLAWDSAFFTNEGVLDPEELAIVNGTYWKMGQHAFSQIHEEILKSSESHTTLTSESMMLESLEFELFEKLRISTQKSNDKCTGPEFMESQVRDKINFPCPNTSKTPVTRRYPVPKQGKPGIPKDVTRVQLQAHPLTSNCKPSSRPPRSISETPRTANRKKSAPQLGQGKNTDEKGQLSLSGIISKTSPAKKGSSCSSTPTKLFHPASPARSGSWSSSSERIGFSKVLPPKKNAAASSSIHRSSPAVKTPSLSSTPTKMLQMASPTHSGSWSSSLNQSRKFPLVDSTKRNVPRKNYRCSPSLAERSITKEHKGETVSRNGSKSNSTPRSIFGFFSSGSPSRSVDSFGSTSSSSSASTGRKRAGSLIVDHNSARLRKTSECSSEGRSKINLEKDNLCNPYKSNSLEQKFKPSGLRLPTPKIGYFDVDKSAFQSSPRCSKKPVQSRPHLDNHEMKYISGGTKAKINKVHSIPCTEMHSRLTGSLDQSSSSSKPAHIQIPISASYLLDNAQINTYNVLEANSDVLKNIPPCGYIGTKSIIRGDQVAGKDSLVFSMSSATSKDEAITDSQPGKSSPSMSKTIDKENLYSFDGNSYCKSKESKTGVPKVVTVEQLEKRLSSLKLSLSEAASGNARDSTPFFDKSNLIPEKRGPLSNSLNPSIFSSLSRTTLSENKHEYNGSLSKPGKIPPA